MSKGDTIYPTTFLAKSSYAIRNLPRLLDQHVEQISPQPLTNEQLDNLRYFWLDGLFAAASEAFFLNYTGLFARSYGASNSQVGLISSIGNLLGAVALFPGARAVEWVGRRKPIILWFGGGIGRFSLLLLALLPFFLGAPAWAIVGIIVLNGLRIFMSNFSNPAWTALVADVVPNSMRGRFISSRNFGMAVATLLMTPLAGWLISTGQSFGADPQSGYQSAYLLAFLVGLLSTWAFSRIQENAEGSITKKETGGLRQLWRENVAFRGFVVGAFIWNLSLHIAGPFFNIYMKSGLGATEGQIGFSASISSLSAIVGQLFWGRVLDRKGAAWLQTLTGFLIPILPVLWIFYTAPQQVYINNAFGGGLWAGYNLANFNLLLSLTPDAQRPRASALYQTVVFTSAVIGPLIGGWMADAVSFNAIFVLSGIGRLVGSLIFLSLMMRSRGAG